MTKIIWFLVIAHASLITVPSIADEQIEFDEPKLARVVSTYLIENQKLDSVVVGGLSGLAWDKDENRLCAVSDFGILYHFKISISENRIEDVALISAFPIRDSSGQPLTGKYNDAEGLDVVNTRNGIAGDTELIIAYERRPRVTRYSPDGNWLEATTLGKSLASKRKHRKPNKSLETALVHGKHGLLLGPDVAMSGQDPDFMSYLVETVINSSFFQTHSNEATSFTGIEELSNGDLLVLERTFDEITKPFIIALSWIKLSDCEAGSICESDTLMLFNSHEHSNLDNFEGLAKLDDYRYLMISDNNENNTQRTLLSLILLE